MGWITPGFIVPYGHAVRVAFYLVDCHKIPYGKMGDAQNIAVSGFDATKASCTSWITQIACHLEPQKGEKPRYFALRTPKYEGLGMAI